ncbi:MAG: T9SS type A sorting domain-containing protein [bacterium]|nr:T9SS type A sorting domain-containing protein [bacterium]
MFAESCDFDGRGEWLVRGYTGSRIENCEFVCYSNVTDLLSLSGSDIGVSGCRFGPSSGWYPVVRLNTLGDCVIEECLFDSIDTRESLIDVSMACPGPVGSPVTIRNNIFRNYWTTGQSVGTIAISLLCQGDPTGDFGIVENNTFENGRAGGAHAPGLVIRGSVAFHANQLVNLEPQTLPDVWADARLQDTILARANAFLPPGLAMSTAGTVADARWNWWGESTGPYNAANNPDGQGSGVGNSIQFDPWLLQHPDSSSDTSTVAETPRALVPSNFSLSAFPNPFNPTSTLMVTVPRAGEYVVTLYDVTGREVRRLFSGGLAGRTEIAIKGEGLASGLYFARLHTDRQQFAATKLLLLK